MVEFVPLTRKAASEAIGTAFLLATVIGSGIMGERLSGGNVAIALLANTIATGAAAATLLFRWLAPALPESAEAVIIPHNESVFLSATEGKADGRLRERQDFR
jgi:hypothetical membrane protein